VRLLATVGGLGYLPLAPGTWGSLAGLPLSWALARCQPVAALAGALAVTAVAVAVAERAEGAFATRHDASQVVIDEVAGMAWTLLWLPPTWGWSLLGFGLFRLLDATKPGPIGWLDRRVHGGLGVVLDDVAAGALAWALLQAARPWLRFAWLG
jgi:phosphatidylglycerophosphatase A